MPEIWRLGEAVELQTLHDGYTYGVHLSIHIIFFLTPAELYL